ncbi:MAG: Flp pilus assembly complex ATPase component TadA [Thiotrichales bacterium]|nr:Flp pilus assembly complex ATPase component TadA [Thiotrichales bacterium]
MIVPASQGTDFVEGLLIKHGIVTKNQMEMAKFHSAIQKDVGISEAISMLGFASEIDILKIISVELGFDSTCVISGTPHINYQSVIEFSQNLALGVSVSRKQCVFDVDYEEKLVKLALSDPTDNVGLARTERHFHLSGFKCEPYVVTKLNLALVQKRIYQNAKHYKQIFLDAIASKADQGEGVNTLTALLFEYAALENSSDIYFNYNTLEGSVSYVFFRIDRKKVFKLAFPYDTAKRLVQSIKQRSGMEAGKLKGHQDGSLEVRILDEMYVLNVRVNSISTVSGEQVTMRIQMEDRPNLKDLGFSVEHYHRIKEILFSLKGIVVLSGVTGSGKTTTLYSMLAELDADAYNIITMEDPVEIKFKNINQVQINEDAGQSFSETIRAVLRQAPDVILLGEVRDAETASRAVEMALTGHLVLTTIHANSISTIEDRLRDLGVDNVGAFIKQIEVGIHQELVPKESGEPGLVLNYEIGFQGLTEVLKNND